ncbi:hypothetical protein JB92DRAFT_3044569 [Gautieria morchelliformis]|nr:hypothetical protein JB92DRAFT_3044569 [Gautieria morchelliformis]
MDSFLETPLPKPTKRPEARPPVRISFAKHKDGPTLARLFLLAFEEDKWGPALHPEQAGLTTAELLSQHGPLVMRKIQRRLVEHHIYTTASVRTTDDAGNETDTVVGWASWTNPARVRRRSFWEWLWAEVIYPLQEFLFRPAISPGLPQQVKETYEAQYSETFGPGSGWEGRRNWYLHILCVHPRWQGLGIGGALLEWGFERAKDSNAAIYVEST